MGIYYGTYLYACPMVEPSYTQPVVPWGPVIIPPSPLDAAGIKQYLQRLQELMDLYGVPEESGDVEVVPAEKKVGHIP